LYAGIEIETKYLLSLTVMPVNEMFSEVLMRISHVSLEWNAFSSAIAGYADLCGARLLDLQERQPT
jgi:hypothetical protein